MDPRITNAARLQQQRNYPAAEEIYRRILLTEPKNVDVLLLLGLLLHETGRNEESVETLRRGLRVQPHRAEVHQTLVGPLTALGRITEAAATAREVARLRPLVADAHHTAATLLLHVRDSAAALPYAKRAAELKPTAAAAWVTLARAYHQQNAFNEALAAVDRALAIDPHHADALIDKALLRQSQGQLIEAVNLYQAGLMKSPRNVAALNNLGSCLLMLGRNVEALRSFESAAEVWPTSPKPRNNIGAALKEMGQIDAAIVQFQKSIEIDPTYADAYCNIGGAYTTIGKHDLAMTASREALRIKPDFAEVGCNLLMCMLSPADLSPAKVFAEHAAWDRAHAAALRGPSVVAMGGNRKIRIAYISPDFREHSIRYFMEPILANHDRSQFEVICCATGRRRDEVTDRLARLVDSWQFVAHLTDAQLADQIRGQQIDILVDLAGHTSDNRLLTFARKPAPVQVTYLGYPTTTGMSAMDFRLTDAICDPPGAEAFYTEKLVRLPNAFFTYTDDPAAYFDPALPADRNGHFTFGSFNSFTKINDETLDSWAVILHGVPNSRLLMKARPLENPSTREYVTGFFAARGIPLDRLDLRAWVSMPEHTAMLGSAIDLMLDTFPYNGHTTSCQAIWRGVPVVTRSGDSFRSRVGECILHNLDLADFVGFSKLEYEQTAIAIASDLPRLRQLRPILQSRMKSSPLCNAVSFTRSLEEVYRQMLPGISAESFHQLFERGLAAQYKGDQPAAIHAYEMALALDPANIGALNNLGACYLLQHRFSEAIAPLKKAVELDPNDPRSRNNLGTALEDRYDEAIEQYAAAYALDPGFVDAIHNLAGARSGIGDHQAAIDLYRQLIKISPGFTAAHAGILFSLLQEPGRNEAAILDEHQAWDLQHAAGFATELPPPVIQSDHGRRLRIGYVSPDFREHSVRFFIEPVLQAHDKSQVEVFCYAAGSKEDAATERLKTLPDAWRNAGGLTDRQLAERIREDRVDILVDLAGHSAENRLLTFAYRPAPVQVTYLGYPMSTGMSAIDYRLTDAICDPPGADVFYSEKLVRLPNAFFVYSDDPLAVYHPALPADRNGYFTFASFNSFLKVNDETLDAWAAILRGVPNSRLLMKTKPLANPSTRQRVIDSFAKNGISPDRLDLRGWVTISEHTALLGSNVDVMLDTFPYNGHTTSCQSIWYGVPVITRSGNSFRSRVGECIMRNLDLPEFIGSSKSEYEQTAIRISTDLPLLRQLRPTLRKRMLESPLYDAVGFTRSLERAYREMWRDACERQHAVK